VERRAWSVERGASSVKRGASSPPHDLSAMKPLRTTANRCVHRVNKAFAIRGNIVTAATGRERRDCSDRRDLPELRFHALERVERRAWSVERGASSVERRASSVERRAWSVERGASSPPHDLSAMKPLRTTANRCVHRVNKAFAIRGNIVTAATGGTCLSCAMRINCYGSKSSIQFDPVVLRFKILYSSGVIHVLHSVPSPSAG
jgi:hypothetical protein